MPPSIESVLRLTTAEDELARQAEGIGEWVWLAAMVMVGVLWMMNSDWFRRQGP